MKSIKRTTYKTLVSDGSFCKYQNAMASTMVSKWCEGILYIRSMSGHPALGMVEAVKTCSFLQVVAMSSKRAPQKWFVNMNPHPNDVQQRVPTQFSGSILFEGTYCRGAQPI